MNDPSVAIELKVARIGNSRGVRLPAKSLRRYGIGTAVRMEEVPEGILLRPTGPDVVKLSWRETAREMANAAEDWSGWNRTIADGLDELPWVDRAKRETPKVRRGSLKSAKSAPGGGGRSRKQ